MPVKNAGNFLTKTLLSIQNQTENNWELICVNDNSTDNSEQILLQFSKKDKRISYLNNPNSGIIPSLQIGYKKSSGEFIHRMDADDLMPMNKLELLKSCLTAKGKGYVATGKVKYFSNEGVKDGYLNYESWLNELCEKNRHWEELFKECTIASPNWLVYRSDFDKCKGFESEVVPEDYDLVFRFYQGGLQVLSTVEVTHLWRDHSERTSRTHKDYSENTFFELKANYFIDLKYNKKRPLHIWGAGKKGKKLARLLQEKDIEFTWVSNNPNKHGKDIYNETMKSFEEIATKNNPQIIITVALKGAKTEIISFLENLNLQEGIDFYFFS